MPLTTFLVKKEFSLHRSVLIFQPTVNSRVSDNQSMQCHNRISRLEKMQLLSGYIYIYIYIHRCLWRGLGVNGVHSGSWMKAWPSRVLQHSKPQQFTKEEWTKCLQTSKHCLPCFYKSFGNLKGSLHNVLSPQGRAFHRPTKSWRVLTRGLALISSSALWAIESWLVGALW